jgi:hypothetical protein
MKRFQHSPDEANRLGHILFWLFPYEQETFRRGKTRTRRPKRNFGYGRAYGDVRQLSRVGAR